MTKSDYQEFLVLFFQRCGISKKILSDKIEEGVNMGYPVEVQVLSVKKLFNKLRANT